MKFRILLGLLCLFTLTSYSKTFTSNQSGSWDNPAIWTISGNGGNNTWPQTGDEIVVQSGHVIILNVNIGDMQAQNGVQSLVVNLGGKLLWDSVQNNNAGFLLFASGGSFTINGVARIRCYKLKNNAGVSVVSTTGSFTARDCSYIERDLQINGFASFGGTVDLSGGSITTTGSGSITFGTGATVTGTGTVFNISTTTVNTQLASGNGFSVSGFTWNGTGTSAWNTASNWSGNAVPTGTSAVSIMPGVQPVLTSAASCKSLIVNNNCSVTVNAGGSLSATDSIILKTGTTPAVLNINTGGSVTTGGTFRLESGTAMNLAGTATATSNGAMNLAGSAAITLNGTSALTANGNLTLAGTSSITVNPGSHMNTGSGSTMTLGSGTSLQIKANAYVTAAGPAVLNGSNCLVIESNATGTGSFIDNGTISGTGNAKIQRYVTMGAWHLVSSPISNGLTGVFTGSYLKNFTESTNTWNDSCIGPVNISLPKGKGYGLWPTTTKAFDFIGIPTTGTVNTVVSFTGAGKGFNLVGNPYPSALDWNAATGFTSVNVNDYFFIWNPVDGYYGYYQRSTGLGSHGVSRYIPLGQGFFVAANAASPSFSINNNARVHNFTQAYLKDEPAAQYLRLTFSGEAGSDDAVVVFGAGNDEGYDTREDIFKWFGVETGPEAYTISGNEEKVALNALPELENDVVMPVYLQIGTDGQYTASGEGLSTLPSSFHYYLEDKMTGSIVDLKKQNEYVFTAKSSDPEGRFNMHFLKNALGTGDHAASASFLVYSKENMIGITCPDHSLLPAHVSVYDMTGRLVTGKMINGTSNEIRMNGASGYYLVRITSGNEVVTKKVFLN